MGWSTSSLKTLKAVNVERNFFMAPEKVLVGVEKKKAKKGKLIKISRLTEFFQGNLFPWQHIRSFKLPSPLIFDQKTMKIH